MNSIKDIIESPFYKKTTDYNGYFWSPKVTIETGYKGNVLIQDYNHFLELVNEFDSLFNTKTYVIHASIIDVLTAFNLEVRGRSNNEIYSLNDSIAIDKDFEILFHDTNTISAKNYHETYLDKVENTPHFELDYWLTYTKKRELKYERLMKKRRDIIQHYIRVSTLISHIKQNIPLKYSMGLHYMNDITILHPGGSRSKVSGIYKKPVYFVITDYTKKIFQDYPMFDFYKPEDVRFPVDNCFIRILHAKQSNSIDQKNKDVVLKEVDEDSYDHKNLNDLSIHYKSYQFILEDDKFYYNNQCIFIKQDDHRWKINI